MDLSDIQYKITDFFRKVEYQIEILLNKCQRYFQSLDQWEWVGWGGEALGLILVIVSLFLF